MYDKNFYTHENSLLIGLVLLGDIIISTTLYLLFNNLFNNSVPEIDLRQILLTNAIVYLMCTANRGVVLYKRKVTNFDIVAKVNRNIVMYAIFSCLQAYHTLFCKGGPKQQPKHKQSGSGGQFGQQHCPVRGNGRDSVVGLPRHGIL